MILFLPMISLARNIALMRTVLRLIVEAPSYGQSGNTTKCLLRQLAGYKRSKYKIVGCLGAFAYVIHALPLWDVCFDLKTSSPFQHGATHNPPYSRWLCAHNSPTTFDYIETRHFTLPPTHSDTAYCLHHGRGRREGAKGRGLGTMDRRREGEYGRTRGTRDGRGGISSPT